MKDRDEIQMKKLNCTDSIRQCPFGAKRVLTNLIFVAFWSRLSEN